MTNVVCIIPARMASSRFPGKPLKPLLGLPLVLHVLERCRLCPDLGRVLVATCDQEIFEAVVAHGGEAVMTADTHEGCVDRTVEAIENAASHLAKDDLVLMVQGDEVTVSPEMLTDMVQAYRRTGAPVVNLASRIYSTDDHDDPNVVKVVAGPDGQALFFSRSPIPSRSRAKGEPLMLQQTGVIAFSRGFLDEFARMPRTPLEITECIDMLRVIEHRREITIVTTDVATIGVDTEADRARAEVMLRDDAVTSRYMTV